MSGALAASALLLVASSTFARVGNSSEKTDTKPKLSPTKSVKVEYCIDLLDQLNGITMTPICPAIESAPVKKVIPKVAPVTRASPSGFKSEGDLRRYLECYATEKGRYKQISKEYLPIVESAARAFEIPTSLLACLIFKESRFDPHATSMAPKMTKDGKVVKDANGRPVLVPNARGLGQHLENTMKYLSALVQPLDATNLKKWSAMSQLTPRELAKQSGMSLEKAIDSVTLAKTKITNQMYAIDWESYYSDLELNGKHSGGTPRNINVGTIKDPKIAIGATALYYKTLLMHFKNTLDANLNVANGDDQKPNADFLLAAAGTYNMGPAATALIASVKPPDPKKWVEALLKSNEETAAHILSIRNCIESSSSSKGNAWKAPINSHNLDCNAAGAGPPKALPGGKNVLPKTYQNDVKSAGIAIRAVIKEKKKKAKDAKDTADKADNKETDDDDD